MEPEKGKRPNKNALICPERVLQSTFGRILLLYQIQTAKEINSKAVISKEAKIDKREVNNSHLAVNKNSVRPQLTKPHALFPVLATMVNNKSQLRKPRVLPPMLATPVNKV